MFSSIIAWMQMGGYGHYVWSAYGLGGIIVLSNWVYTRRLSRQLHQDARKRHAAS